MVPVLVQRLGISGEKKCRDITKGERRALLELLKCFSVEVSGPRPIADAIVTSGGVKAVSYTHLQGGHHRPLHHGACHAGAGS